MVQAWPVGLAVNPSWQGSCGCALHSLSFNLDTTARTFGSQLRSQAGRHQPQNSCQPPLPLPALCWWGVRMMLYQSSGKKHQEKRQF